MWKQSPSIFSLLIIFCSIVYLATRSFAISGASPASALSHAPPPAPRPQANTFDVKSAQRFADLALACVHKEYPNKLAHSLNSDADVAPPRKLTPAFYGCYDWHSSVHGHWLLARLTRT